MKMQGRDGPIQQCNAGSAPVPVYLVKLYPVVITDGLVRGISIESMK